MKSPADTQTVNFTILQTRLLQLLNSRINNGEFTERGLARLIGVSQPQLHNVLKGKRRLQTELADRILQKFSLSILGLLHQTELREQLIASPGTQESKEVPSGPQSSVSVTERCPRKPSGREVIRRPPVQDLIG